MNRRGALAGALGTAAAAAGAVAVVDRRIRGRRQIGRRALDRFVEPEADRTHLLRTADGVELYVVEDGPLDAPVTVVFSHGFTLDHNDFLFQRRELLDRFGGEVRLISYDHRSHGRSTRSDTAHATIDQLGADLHQVIGTLAPSGPLVLVGHSMGGMTIMALADEHPELFGERVAGVVLLDTSTGKLATVTLGLPAMMAKLRGPVLPLLLRGAGYAPGLVERGRARTSDAAWLFLRRAAFGSRVDPALVEFLSTMIAHTRVDVIADFYSTLMSHDKLAALDALHGVRTLIVCGDRDVLTPPDHSRAMAAALPDADLVLVEGAGHQALMERPEIVNDALITLVENVLADVPRRAKARR